MKHYFHMLQNGSSIAQHMVDCWYHTQPRNNHLRLAIITGTAINESYMNIPHMCSITINGEINLANYNICAHFLVTYLGNKDLTAAIF
jgi:hypothetical protein